MLRDRITLGLIGCLVLALASGCAPQDPRSRLDGALAVLHSDASGARKARACTDIRAALAEYPVEAPGRSVLLERVAAEAAAALRDPAARWEAGQTLLAIGPASYEPLFSVVLEADRDTRDAARSCLIRMSNTAVPALLPALLGDDVAAQARAEQILTTLGSPISEILRANYADVLQPFSGSAGEADAPMLSTRGRTGVLAFARVLGSIGDRAAVLALVRGADALHFRHPDLAASHLRTIDSLGAGALEKLGASDRLTYERLRLLLIAP